MDASYNLDFDEIKELLDLKVEQFNTPHFIKDDPILLPHQFQKKQDIEIIGFLTALIAWGKRSMIIKNGERLIQIMDNQPHQFVLNYNSNSLKDKTFVHRTFNTIDLDFIFRALQQCYLQFGSLEYLFVRNEINDGIQSRILHFRNYFMQTEHLKRSEKHIANPAKGSAAKRINMFLRWMVRKDEKGVDFGLWNTISPKELCIPLDVHSGRIARMLGLLHRKQNDWKALEEVMTNLRLMDENDPCKYDFALFGLGVSGELDSV